MNSVRMLMKADHTNKYIDTHKDAIINYSRQLRFCSSKVVECAIDEFRSCDYVL